MVIKKQLPHGSNKCCPSHLLWIIDAWSVINRLFLSNVIIKWSLCYDVNLLKYGVSHWMHTKMVVLPSNRSSSFLLHKSKPTLNQMACEMTPCQLLDCWSGEKSLWQPEEEWDPSRWNGDPLGEWWRARSGLTPPPSPPTIIDHNKCLN